MKTYDPTAPRKATNVSVNSDLLRQARDAGLNLSGLLEERLVEVIRELQREEWLAENRDAFDAYNARIETVGTFGDKARRF